LATVKREVKIVNKYGLHARPAMQFVELANRYGSKIEVSNGALVVDAKSIMSVMRLAATQGTVLKIVADGADAAEAVEALSKLVSSGFGMMEENVPDISI
jgi:phosphocarrier protein